MKLVFPNGEHEQVELGDGISVIGSGAECDVRIENESVAQRHAQIELGPNGASIKVFDVTNITRINGELVVATRLLTSGDALLFGEVQSVVVGDVSVQAEQPTRRVVTDPGSTRVRAALPSFVLRGVSGGSFGKTFPIYETTSIGRAGDADVCLRTEEVSRQHARIRIGSDGLHIEDLGSSNGTYVNGKRIKRVKLEPGDEIKFDTERFIVQAPGTDFNAPLPAVDEEPGASGWTGKLVLIALLAAAAIWLAIRQGWL